MAVDVQATVKYGKDVEMEGEMWANLRRREREGKKKR